MLLKRVREYGKENGFSSLSVYVPKLFGRSGICSGEDSFISSNFSDNTEETYGEWNTTLEVLGRHSMFLNNAIGEHIKNRCERVALSKMARMEQEAEIEFVAEQPETKMLYPVPGNEHLLEYDLSFICYEKGTERGTITGALLIQKAGDTLFPVLIYGTDAMTIMGLMRSAVLAAEKRYDHRQQFRVIIRDRKSHEPGHHVLMLPKLLDDIFQMNRPGFGRHTKAYITKSLEETNGASDMDDPFDWKVDLDY